MSRDREFAKVESQSGDGVPQTKAFRFKKPTEVTHENEGADQRHSKRHRHHHHSSRHQKKRQKTSSHLADDPTQMPNNMRHVPPDHAFEESLFDALGDDEGAAFWEGVYGQPIHTYPNTYIDEDTGEVTQMDDEEYAQYVRRKMWEKSREGIEAAKEEKRREQARSRQKREEQQHDSESTHQKSQPYNNFGFDFELEASLRRGKRRREQKYWQGLWKDYIQRWDELRSLASKKSQDESDANVSLRDKISWPVESSKRKDIKAEEIQGFIQKCAQSTAGPDTKRDALSTVLKIERVRWHPDKIQQRYGAMQIDEDTMQGVTATFQVLDKMWNDAKLDR